MNRRLLVGLTTGAALVAIGVVLYPVGSTVLRLGLIAALCVVWFGVTVLMWERKTLRVVFLLMPALLAAPFLLPTRVLHRDELRDDYVRCMAALERTPYVWGGESSLGIDCSGLPRHALRRALFGYGLRNADGGALRRALELWWFDSSARALGRGYRGYTVPLAISGTVAAIDSSRLTPGDLAVTSDGRHLLAYAGGDNWIQADPGVGSVVTLNARTAHNPWFECEVSIHRWSVLAGPTRAS